MPKIGRILIVEDESSIRETLECFLDNGGFITGGVSSASEAIVFLLQNSVDVCITDVGLPDYEAAEWIPEAARLYPGLEWVLYTGMIDYALSEGLLEVGIKNTHLFYKPALSLCRLKELLVSICCKQKFVSGENTRGPIKTLDTTIKG